MKKIVIVILGTLIAIFLGYQLYKYADANKEIILTLTINGNTYTSDQKVTCKTKKKIHSCNVTLPSIISNTPFLAYNDIPTTKEVLYDFNDTITINDNKTIYIIQEETLTYNLNIDYNGIKELKNNTLTCLASKRIGKCSITLPSVTRRNGEVIGYSNTKSSHESSYNIGDDIILNSQNKTIYVISKEELNYTFNNYDYTNASSVKCFLYNTDTSCKVTLPITTKLGYISQGKYVDNNNKTINMGENYQLKNNTTLKYQYATKVFTINKNIINNYELYNKAIIAYDQNCPTSSYYKDYFAKINIKTPYLFNDIVNLVPLSSSNFDVATNNRYKKEIVGLTNSNISIYRCSNVWNSFDFLVMIHEIVHIKVNAYQEKNHSSIFSTCDLINLFYKYQSKSNRPLRAYAYTSINEFIAELYSYYYLNEIIPTSPYNTVQIPSDMLAAARKINCIFKNNYNSKVC